MLWSHYLKCIQAIATRYMCTSIEITGRICMRKREEDMEVREHRANPCQCGAILNTNIVHARFQS